MNNIELMKELSRPSPTKIVLLVLDGLGGLPDPKTGRSELETARIPNLDRLASESICGLADPVGPGITPGSAPGHLALFGYDPVACLIGRGVLEAVGIDVKLEHGDVAARGNFCTVDEKGLITDRRAGRISTETCTELCKLLDGLDIDGVKARVYPVREHRFVVVFRGVDLEPDVTESDPQLTGVPPLAVAAIEPKAEKLADAANRFLADAKNKLADRHPANMALLRGFSSHPRLPSMQEIYKLNPLAIAIYPMYRGLARLAGMETADAGSTLEDEFAVLERRYDQHDFFFLHVKWTDSAGEDGDFARKVKVLEEFDTALPGLLKLKPDVLVVTGDHSTPATLKGHSWHAVPVMVCGRHCRPDNVREFNEKALLAGGLGRIHATEIMPLAMANALKLTKFGA